MNAAINGSPVNGCPGGGFGVNTIQFSVSGVITLILGTLPEIRLVSTSPWMAAGSTDYRPSSAGDVEARGC